MKKRPCLPCVVFIALFMAIPVPSLGQDAATPSDSDMAALLADEDDGPSAPLPDPLYYLNKGVFHFNDALYTYALTPATHIYRGIVPEPARRGVINFYNNLTAPVRIVNCLLQGKTESAGVELGPFMVNSTIGILGFWNAAAREPNLSPQPDSEDLGQTFGVWGMGHGFYLCVPVIGPSTLRDGLGLAGDSFIDPVFYISSELSPFLRISERLNWLSYHLGEYEEIKAGALDPYESFKDIYLQYRQKAVAR